MSRSFEVALAELEATVRRLDSGDLPLEEALSLYEKGVALQQECQTLLDNTERRIVELRQGASGVEEKPL